MTHASPLAGRLVALGVAWAIAWPAGSASAHAIDAPGAEEAPADADTESGPEPGDDAPGAVPEPGDETAPSEEPPSEAPPPSEEPLGEPLGEPLTPSSPPPPQPLPAAPAPAASSASASPWGDSSSGGSSGSASPWGDDGKDGKRGRRDRTPKPGAGLIAGGSVAFGVAIVGVGVMGAGFSKAGDARDDLESSDPNYRDEVFDDGKKANRMAIAGMAVMAVGLAVGIALVTLGAKKRKQPAEAVARALRLRWSHG